MTDYLAIKYFTLSTSHVWDSSLQLILFQVKKYTYGNPQLERKPIPSTQCKIYKTSFLQINMNKNVTFNPRRSMEHWVRNSSKNALHERCTCPKNPEAFICEIFLCEVAVFFGSKIQCGHSQLVTSSDVPVTFGRQNSTCQQPRKCIWTMSFTKLPNDGRIMCKRGFVQFSGQSSDLSIFLLISNW